MNRYFVPVLICFIFTGCIPKFHHVLLAPEVQGTLRSGENVLVDVALHYDYNPPSIVSECRKTAVVQITDSKGRFIFKTKTEYEAFWVYGDKVFRPRICAEIDGKLEYVWSKFKIGYIEEKFALDCDLTRKDVDKYGTDVKCVEFDV